jgi:predicted PurR-regulated permease PerM
MSDPRRRWLRLLAVAAGAVLVLWALKALASALTPFFVAFALAYFLNPAVNAIEAVFARGLAGSRLVGVRVRPRTAAVATLTVVVLLVLVMAVLIIEPIVYNQVADAVRKAPDYLRTLRARVEPLYERLNLRYPEETEAIRLRIVEAVKNNLPEIVGPITRVIQRAFSSGLAFVLTILNLIVIPVFTVYLLFDMNRITEGVAQLVPYRLRSYLYSRWAQVDRLLSAFVRGQITVCLILGSFYAIALTLTGVPMGLLVGFVIGFFNLIPFMSYLLGLPLALLLSWLDDASPTRLVIVAAVFTFGQFVEGNFITPRIVGERLGLHAVVIMLAVLVGGTLFGFPGMLLAVPSTAALSVFWADLRDLYLDSEFYRAGAPPPAPPPAA